ncbi:hypothetical protein L1987_15849 [Smallanthus sonchifolius]|uniref:Uncharacterized protein n=1 Tax=Smallanthus sonchifolius TaxID=185202 RepID=A0ACB9J6L3_9ASTR|nr:hypothetical protein L1987_15849 [Smallanthus sonchifolius]
MTRAFRRKTTMGVCGLTYAAAVIVLTCAIHAVHTRPHDPFIVQVTDHPYNYLLGTPTERPFTAFIQEHGKQYSTREEYLHRLGVFSKNLLRAAEHQLLDPTAVHGVTPFSDLSEEEFETMVNVEHAGRSVQPAFSKCDPSEKEACDSGCSGGLMTNAYSYLMKAGGIESEETYPYTGKSGECRFDPEKIAVKVANFTNIPADEDQMAAYLTEPSSMGMARSFDFAHWEWRRLSCRTTLNKPSDKVICGEAIVNGNGEGPSCEI